MVALHDRYWASLGVAVVRPGAPMPDVPEGQRVLYMLLRPGESVLFDAAPAIRRLTWSRADALRVRIVAPGPRDVRERVGMDDAGRVHAITRAYESRSRATRAVLTPSAAIARRWASSTERAQRSGILCDAVLRDRMLSHQTTGRVHDAASPVSELLAEVMSDWDGAASLLEGVMDLGPGVIADRSAVIGSGVRFVGEVWVAPGARVRSGQVVIGPGLALPDVSDQDHAEAWAPAGPVRWGVAPLPGWRRSRVGARRSALVKRAFDVAFSVIALACTLPIYPIIALAIFLEDGGPVFFAHRRQSMGGREFNCFKFRTMERGAEGVAVQLASRNRADGPQVYIPDDPRVTRVGRMLRKCQLDELPQFINVLLGDMSVVGPRPSPEKENRMCAAWREARLSVRPGITGLWQIKRTRAPQADFQEWVRYDLEYVQHGTLRMDIWIIFRTVLAVLRGAFS
ncbi:MAG: sugar transferase [Phycisphaerales bacterium]|nr:sugar transferase [Phycisphaerales bacterium]